MIKPMMAKTITSSPNNGSARMIAAQKACLLTILAVSLSNILSP